MGDYIFAVLPPLAVSRYRVTGREGTGRLWICNCLSYRGRPLGLCRGNAQSNRRIRSFNWVRGRFQMDRNSTAVSAAYERLLGLAVEAE